MSTPSIRLAMTAALKTRGLIMLMLVLGLINALTRFDYASGALMVVTSAASLVASGYLISYSRGVALGATDVPPVTPIATQVRRGLSVLLVGLPGLMLALPAILIAIYPAMLFDLPRWLELGLLGIVVGTLAVACTLPLVAPYLIEDRIAAGYRLKTNLQAAWRHRRLLAAPVAFTALSSAFQLVLTRLLILITAAPALTASPSRHRLTGLAVLGDKPASSIAALLVLVMTMAYLEVATAHLDGQYARMLHEQRGTPV